MHLSAFSSIQTFLSHLSANLCHSCHKSACFHIDWSYLSCIIGLISVGFNFIDLGWNSIWEIAEILGGGAAVEVQIHCSRRLLDFLQSVNLKPSKPTLMICATYCHAPRPTPRAWRSFHTSNPKAYSVTWPKQLSCNWKLPITKYLFRVAKQNLKSWKFDFNTKTSTIQNPLSKYLQI